MCNYTHFFLIFSAANDSSFDLEHLQNDDFWQKGIFLGRGTFNVYLFTHVKTGVKIAVKEVTFDPQDKVSVKHQQALKKEIEHLMKLSHNRIIKYLGCNEDKQNYVMSLCLEYIADGTLSELLHNKGPLDLLTTITFTQQILEGVEYLHKLCIIHRDIKGRNILVNLSSKSIKLADFGISKQLETLSSTHGATTSIFTIKYTAPEVFVKKNYGIKVDIWSVGCTVVEMLTAFPPWNECTEVEVIKNLTNGVYPAYDIPNMCNEMKNFLYHCFQVDPKKRLSAKQLKTSKLFALDGSQETNFKILPSELLPTTESRKLLYSELLPEERQELLVPNVSLTTHKVR